MCQSLVLILVLHAHSRGAHGVQDAFDEFAIPTTPGTANFEFEDVHGAYVRTHTCMLRKIHACDTGACCCDMHLRLALCCKKS